VVLVGVQPLGCCDESLKLLDQFLCCESGLVTSPSGPSGRGRAVGEGEGGMRDGCPTATYGDGPPPGPGRPGPTSPAARER
jgi:hypothetical protein